MPYVVNNDNGFVDPDPRIGVFKPRETSNHEPGLPVISLLRNNKISPSILFQALSEFFML
jgi:hypothetical protein